MANKQLTKFKIYCNIIIAKEILLFFWIQVRYGELKNKFIDFINYIVYNNKISLFFCHHVRYGELNINFIL